MATSSKSKPIPQQSRGSVTSIDLRGGGGYTVYKDPSGITTKVTYSGGGRRTAADVERLVTPKLYSSELLGMSFTSVAAKEKAEAEYKQEQARQKLISQLTGQSRTEQALRTGGGVSAQEQIRQKLMSNISKVKADELTSIEEKSKLGFDTSTISGKIKYNIIEKTPLSILAGKIKSYEERQKESPSKLSQINEELSNKLKITSKGGSKGGSLTQKYFELFGTKFYESGERDKIVNEALKDFTNAKTYEEQQNAVNNLKSMGVKVTLQTDPLTNEQSYKIDKESAYQSLAPTSKVGNVLVGATDIIFKSALFEPYMSTGAAKKQTQKAKVVEKTKESAKSSEKIIQKAEQLFKEGTLEKELYKLNKLATNEVKRQNLNALLNELKNRGLIKGFVQDTQTGKFVLLNSKGETIAPVTSPAPPKLTIDFDISDLANAPRIQNIPQITAGTNVLNTKTNLFIKGTELKDQTGTSKLSDQTSQRFSDLGVTGTRFSQGSETRQKSASKNVLGLKAPQQELLKAEQQARQKPAQKEATALLSMLKTQQALRQEQKQALKQPQLLKQASRVQSTIPKLKIPIFSFGKGQLQRLAKKTEEGELYAVFGKRFGKDIKLFETTSKRKAEEKALQFLKGTLGRSAVITKGGKPLSFGELDLLKSREFRPSKKSKTRIVQKAKFSLGTPSEVKEIQYFKKKSKGKKKKKGFIDWFA